MIVYLIVTAPCVRFISVQFSSVTHGREVSNAIVQRLLILMTFWCNLAMQVVDSSVNRPQATDTFTLTFLLYVVTISETRAVLTNIALTRWPLSPSSHHCIVTDPSPTREGTPIPRLPPLPRDRTTSAPSTPRFLCLWHEPSQWTNSAGAQLYFGWRRPWVDVAHAWGEVTGARHGEGLPPRGGVGREWAGILSCICSWSLM